jgi:hypothetical protein
MHFEVCAGEKKIMTHLLAIFLCLGPWSEMTETREEFVLSLSDSEKQVSAMAELLALNDIEGLPPKFSFWTHKGHMECSDFQDAQGGWIRLAEVVYPVGAQGDRTHLFVFNKDGECLVHAPAWGAFHGDGLHDVTGDGIPELLTTYDDPSDERHKRKLRIWTIGTEAAVLLLDVSFVSLRGGEQLRPELRNAEDGGLPRLHLKCRSSDSLGFFVWDPGEREFAQHAMKPDLCKVFVNGRDIVPMVCEQCPMCGFGPIRSLECPKCGHRFEAPAQRAKLHSDAP